MSGKFSIDLKWEKCCDQSGTFIFGWIFFILAGNKDNHNAPMSLNVVKIPSQTTELAALDESMNNVVTTLAPLFFIGSSTFLQVTRTTIKYWMGLKFYQIRLQTVELAAIECLEKST